jgi:hypothetical protein
MNTQPLTPQSAGITGPMNINAVITHLIEMTPGQRKQFAQLHMDDPMMLSAAKFVDNQVFKQAQSLAAQQTGAAPPPVNQQAVEQMTGSALPEDTGIAQLPAENMPSEYAGGGIVAFSEGGKSSAEKAAQREADRRNLLTIPAYLEDSALAVPKHIANAGTFISNKAKNAYARVASALQNEDVPVSEDAPYYRILENTNRVRGNVSQEARADDRQRRDPAVYAPEREVSPAARRDDRPNLSSLQGQTNNPLPRAETQRGGGPRADTGPTAPTASSYKETPYSPAASEGLGKIYNDIVSSQGEAIDPFAAQNAQKAQLRNKMGQEEFEAAEARKAGIKDLLNPREKRIAEREARLGQQDDLNLNMSMINAGLAMMQSTGKGLAGIAEGAQKGVGQFTEGLRINEAARQKIEEAKDAFDELKYNLTNMSEKEIMAAKRTIGEGQITSANEAIAAIAQDRGIKLEAAKTIFMKQLDQMTSRDRMAFDAAQAASGREFASSERISDQTFRATESAKQRAAAAASAAASLAAQERLATRPGAQERLYESIATNPRVREGYRIAREEGSAGSLEAAKLRIAKDIVNNAVTPSQRNSEEYKNAQRTLQNALRMSGLTTGNVPDDMLMSRPN